MEPEKVETGPPALIEAAVRLFTPPACREYVLGDLCERYRSPGQYVSDAIRTVPYIIVSRIRRTSSAPLLAFQVASTFLTFAGPTLIPVPSAVAATTAAATMLMIRQAYRADSRQWPKGPAMDAFSAVLGSIVFSLLWQTGTRDAVSLIAALDSGTGAFLLMFAASVLWAPKPIARPGLRRRIVYLAACAVWATVLGVPASMFSGFATGALIENSAAAGSVSAGSALFPDTVVTVVTLAPIAGVIGAMFLCVTRPRLALGAFQHAAR